MAKLKSGLVARYSALGYGILTLLNISMLLFMAITLYFVDKASWERRDLFSDF